MEATVQAVALLPLSSEVVAHLLTDVQRILMRKVAPANPTLGATLLGRVCKHSAGLARGVDFRAG